MKENTAPVSFRIGRTRWNEFLNICHDKDMSGSQVLRNYILLICDKKLTIPDKRVWEYPEWR